MKCNCTALMEDSVTLYFPAHPHCSYSVLWDSRGAEINIDLLIIIKGRSLKKAENRS